MLHRREGAGGIALIVGGSAPLTRERGWEGERGFCTSHRREVKQRGRPTDSRTVGEGREKDALQKEKKITDFFHCVVGLNKRNMSHLCPPNWGVPIH